MLSVIVANMSHVKWYYCSTSCLNLFCEINENNFLLLIAYFFIHADCGLEAIPGCLGLEDTVEGCTVTGRCQRSHGLIAQQLQHLSVEKEHQRHPEVPKPGRSRYAVTLPVAADHFSRILGCETIAM